jgi:hypothetical protein
VTRKSVSTYKFSNRSNLPRVTGYIGSSHELTMNGQASSVLVSLVDSPSWTVLVCRSLFTAVPDSRIPQSTEDIGEGTLTRVRITCVVTGEEVHAIKGTHVATRCCYTHEWDKQAHQCLHSK